MIQLKRFQSAIRIPPTGDLGSQATRKTKDSSASGSVAGGICENRPSRSRSRDWPKLAHS